MDTEERQNFILLVNMQVLFTSQTNQENLVGF